MKLKHGGLFNKILELASGNHASVPSSDITLDKAENDQEKGKVSSYETHILLGGRVEQTDTCNKWLS